MRLDQVRTWFKKGSGPVVRSTLRAVPATGPDPFLNHGWQGGERWEKWAVTVWLLVAVVIAGRLLIWPNKSAGVYPIFAEAAQNWWAGADLYYWNCQPGRLDHFRYSPLVAAALSPLAAVPDRVGA